MTTLTRELNQNINKYKPISICRWKSNGEYWFTECGERFIIHDYDRNPSENGMKFCCYCGLKLVEVADESR